MVIEPRAAWVDVLCDELLFEAAEEGCDHVAMLKAVDVNLEFVLFELDLALDALDEQLVDGLRLHGEDGLGRFLLKLSTR